MNHLNLARLIYCYPFYSSRVIDGQEYDGIVKEKEKAEQQYSQAVSLGQSAGIVRYTTTSAQSLLDDTFVKMSLLRLVSSSVGRTLEEFKTSVTVAAHKKVTFELTYEELLKRRLGKYELQIHARPMQPVKDFKVSYGAGVEPSFTLAASQVFPIQTARLMCTLRRRLASRA